MNKDLNLKSFSNFSTTINDDDLNKKSYSKLVFLKKENKEENLFKSIINFNQNSERKLSYEFSDRKKKIKKNYSERKLSYQNSNNEKIKRKKLHFENLNKLNQNDFTKKIFFNFTKKTIIKFNHYSKESNKLNIPKKFKYIYHDIKFDNDIDTDEDILTNSLLKNFQILEDRFSDHS